MVYPATISALLDNKTELSRRAVFGQPRQQPTVTRTEIVAATGLSKALVLAIVAELMTAGLVEETGIENRAFGRPRVLLQLVDAARLALGAEVTADECRVVLTDLRAKPLRIVQQEAVDSSLSGLVATLEQCVSEATAGIDKHLILGMGVAVPGIVHQPSGTVAHAVLVDWHDVPLGQELAGRFARKVSVFSRGNARLWGEYWYGAGKGEQKQLDVRLSAGIGGGLVLNGHTFLRRDYAAGEFGHFTVQPNGLPCLCGNRGCLVTVASLVALLNRIRQIMVEPAHQTSGVWSFLDGDLRRLNLPIALEAAKAGDPARLQALNEVGRWLGVALGSAVDLLNLDKVIVGGPLAEAGEALFGPLRQELSQRSETTHLRRARIVESGLGENAAANGAASLMLPELTATIKHPMASRSPGNRAHLPELW